MPTESLSVDGTAPTVLEIGRAAEWLRRAVGECELPPLLVAIGLGQGHLLDVLEQVAPETRVLALEPDPLLANAFRARPDRRRWFDSGRLTYLAGPDYAGADEAWRIFPSNPDRHLVLIEPDTARRGGPTAVAAARTLKAIVFGARANATARRKFAPTYLTNSLSNLPAITRGADVRALSGAYAGCPALIVGAGPSLDGAIDRLGEATNRALIISTDTALRPLLGAGVQPNLAVGADPGEKNARHFRALPSLAETWLVAESAIDPRAAAVFDDRILWFRLSDHEPWPWFQSMGLETGHLKIWGSVLTAAFQTAVLAGCDPIVFVGSDLSFMQGQPYARGTTYEYDWGFSTAVGDTLADAWRKQRAMHDRATVLDVHGREIETTAPLVAFRDWLLLHAARCGRRVINASGAGILFGQGIEIAALWDVLSQRLDLAPVSRLGKRPPDAVLRRDLARHCRRIRRDLTSGVLDAPLASWQTFVGGALPQAALETALEAAAAGLGAVPDVHAARSGRGTSPATVDRHPMPMPESLARLRAWLNGTGDVGTVDRSERTGLLSRAFPLVVQAVGRLLEASTAEVISPPRDQGVVPVSGSHEWPEDLGWLLQSAEHLIGASCEGSRSGNSVESDGFFTRAVFPRRETPASAVPVRPSTHAPTRRLAGQLVGEWLLTAATTSSNSQRRPEAAALPYRALRDRLRVVSNALTVDLAAGADPDASGAEAALVISSSADERDVRVEWPIGPAPLLARATTGFLRRVAVAPPVVTRDVTRDLDSGRVDTRLYDVGLRIGRDIWPLIGPPAEMTDVFTPRILTDEGLPPSVVMTTVHGGALCASLHGDESFVIGELGEALSHVTWPRPICGVLPAGETGWIAWGNGTHTWPSVGDGYVMVRRASAAEPQIEDLPCRPTSAVWGDGVLYWSTFPTGFASWTPEDGVTVLDTTLPVIGLSVDRAGLLLVTGERTTEGNLVRTSSHQSWRWSPAAGLVRDEPGVAEPATCRSADNGWTANVYMDADAVDISHADDRRARLSCYYPFGAAWAGRSLVIATALGEVLLFERLQDRI